MTRHDPDQEGRRSVAITLTNAAFSKLIKLGQASRKTPVEMARELFEEGYAARCMSKGVEGSPHDRLKPGEALADELAEQLRQKLADSGRLLGQAEIAAVQERQAHDATKAALAEAKRERDELSRRCWNAETELERLREAPAEVGPAEIEAAAQAAIAELANEPLPEPEPAPPPIGRGTVKAVLAMRGMGATAGEIAKDLALRREIVDQVLREHGA
jgi:hypothetical protein